MVHEQSQKKNDRKRDTDQPKQRAFTKAHNGLHNLCCVVNSGVPREFRILNRRDGLLPAFGGIELEALEHMARIDGQKLS